MHSKTIIGQIEALKKERDAIILVHNYQLPEVQEIADYVGDSLELAKLSHDVTCKTILFCGVHFMAETAKIFNPDRKVLIPDLHAGCPMADMISPEQLQKEKDTHPHASVVCYVNSTAHVKALSDICCTSANGVQVAKSVEESEILFVPDKYLGSYVARHVTDKKFYLWSGYCPTHMVFSKEGVLRVKEEYPHAEIVVHPECRLDVQEIANAICPNMKLTTLEKVLWSLEDTQYEIEVEESIRSKAFEAIKRMVQM